MAFYSSKSEKKSEKPKVEPFSTVLLILVLLLAFYGVGYFIGTNLVPQEEKRVDTTSNQKKQDGTYDVESPKIVRLLSNLVSGNSCQIEEFANSQVITVKDLFSERIFQIVEYGSLLPSDVSEISLEDFQKEISHYLADGYTFDPLKIDFSKICSSYTYDSKNLVFKREEKECSSPCGVNESQYQITKAAYHDEVLTLTVRVLFGSSAESTNYYKDYLRTEFVTNDIDQLDSYFSQGGEYIFTFKDDNNHFVFVSSKAK